MSLSLQILDTVGTCEGCGACCQKMGSPPGYCLIEFRPPDLPADLAAELDAYYAKVAVNHGFALDRDSAPCLWFDPETKRCKHYEWRPDICRDFPRGSPACRQHRVREGIDADLGPFEGMTEKQRDAYQVAFDDGLVPWRRTRS